MTTATELIDDLDPRDVAISVHSDTYKDVYGVRPRRDWTGYTIEEIEAETDELFDELDDEFEVTYDFEVERQRMWDEQARYDAKLAAEAAAKAQAMTEAVEDELAAMFDNGRKLAGFGRR